VRWEFLRRSEVYRKTWAGLEKKYQGKATLKKKRVNDAEENSCGFIYRGQEEKFLARRFGLYDLHPPQTEFSEEHPPEFGRSSSVELATQTSIDLYRDPIQPLPRLRNGKVVVILDLEAGISGIVGDLRKLVPKALMPASSISSDMFLSPHTRKAFTWKQTTLKPKPHRVNDMYVHLAAYDLSQRGRSWRQTAKELWPNEFRGKADVQRCLQCAENLIANAASGVFPGKYY